MNEPQVTLIIRLRVGIKRITHLNTPPHQDQTQSVGQTDEARHAGHHQPEREERRDAHRRARQQQRMRDHEDERGGQRDPRPGQHDLSVGGRVREEGDQVEGGPQADGEAEGGHDEGAEAGGDAEEEVLVVVLHFCRGYVAFFDFYVVLVFFKALDLLDVLVAMRLVFSPSNLVTLLW